MPGFQLLHSCLHALAGGGGAMHARIHAQDVPQRSRLCALCRLGGAHVPFAGSVI